MKFLIPTLSFIAIAMVGACATSPKLPEMTANMNANLTEGEAAHRARLIENVKYDLNFTLSDNQSAFQGQSNISFGLKENPQDVRLDFYQGTVKELKINNEVVQARYNGHFIILPKNSLKKGENAVQVNFEAPYSRDGSGLHRFQDPEDQNVYVYSNLEPFDANRIFPCFDQPDLKATYKMRVKAPKAWTVVTSVMESSKEATDPQSITWNFPESARFSTYIWSLHAGPFKIWHDASGPIPLRLMARQTLTKYVDPKEWFPVTHQGFNFFNSYFDYPYPYKKYDQLIVPEFSSGAMENVAAVTFSERFVSRGKKSRQEKRDLASVILHEMAHMWFGNLVTMKWWNDLWLNESFATYMAAQALVENTPYKEAWRELQIDKTVRAYADDQLVTTHPIVGTVKDTLQIQSYFDGITYEKGAASLRQLSFFIGADNFRLALRNYFKSHANGNTTLADFMGAMAQVSSKDLAQWQSSWLQTPMFNTLVADVKCQGGKIDTLKITQTAPADHPHIRPHSFEIAFLNKSKKRYALTSTMRAEVDRAEMSIPGARGKACPDIVYLNHNDHDYFRTKFDEASLSHLRKGLANVEDPFLRQQIAWNLWQMVRYGELTPQNFADLALGSLKGENDPYVLQTLYFALVGPREFAPSLTLYADVAPAPHSQWLKSLKDQVEVTTWNRLKASAKDSEQQKLFLKFFLRMASTKENLNNLKKLLDGTAGIAGLTLDQDQRWYALSRLSEFRYAGIDRLIEIEEKRDPTALGQEGSIATRVRTPDWSVKEKWIKELKNEKSDVSLRQLRVAFWGLLPPSQKELRQQYAPQFFTDLKTVDGTLPVDRAEALARLAPFSCDTKNQQALQEFIDDNPQLKPSVVKTLRNLQQESEVCGQIVEKLGQG